MVRGRNTPCGVKCEDKAYKLISGVKGADKAYKLISGVKCADKAYKKCGVNGPRTEYPMRTWLIMLISNVG